MRPTAVLTRFRVMAYVVGVMLLILVGVAMPLKYLGDNSAATKVVSPVHGLLYIGYVVATVQLALSRGWPWKRTLLVLLGGVVPFLSFVTERRVVRDEQAVAA